MRKLAGGFEMVKSFDVTGDMGVPTGSRASACDRCPSFPRFVHSPHTHTGKRKKRKKEQLRWEDRFPSPRRAYICIDLGEDFRGYCGEDDKGSKK